MNASVFVDLFRVFWNNIVLVNHMWEESPHKYFDSIEKFKIQYVFGKSKCIAEYCDRKSLTNVVDAILRKSKKLYLTAKSKGEPMTWMDITFDDLDLSAVIRFAINSCNISIAVTPIDIDDRQI